jgi:hypothetical protein
MSPFRELILKHNRLELLEYSVLVPCLKPTNKKKIHISCSNIKSLVWTGSNNNLAECKGALGWNGCSSEKALLVGPTYAVLGQNLSSGKLAPGI